MKSPLSLLDAINASGFRRKIPLPMELVVTNFRTEIGGNRSQQSAVTGADSNFQVGENPWNVLRPPSGALYLKSPLLHISSLPLFLSSSLSLVSSQLHLFLVPLLHFTCILLHTYTAAPWGVCVLLQRHSGDKIPNIAPSPSFFLRIQRKCGVASRSCLTYVIQRHRGVGFVTVHTVCDCPHGFPSGIHTAAPRGSSKRPHSRRR